MFRAGAEHLQKCFLFMVQFGCRKWESQLNARQSFRRTCKNFVKRAALELAEELLHLESITSGFCEHEYWAKK
jgi:hypothetical protein